MRLRPRCGCAAHLGKVRMISAGENRPFAGWPGLLPEISIEPAEGPIQDVAAMVPIGDLMAFSGIDNQVRRDAQGAESVPELLGLRSRTLAIVSSDQNESWGLDLANEFNRRAARIDRRGIINRRAEERDHPLVDTVFAIIALPVGDAGPRHGRAETVGLGYGPHSHITAVAPTG